MNEEIFAKVQIKKIRGSYEISIFYKVFYNGEFRRIADVEDSWERKKILEKVHSLRLMEIDKNKGLYYNTRDLRTRSGQYVTSTEAETGVSVLTKFQDVHISRVPKIIFEVKRVFGNNLIIVKEKIV